MSSRDELRELLVDAGVAVGPGPTLEAAVADIETLRDSGDAFGDAIWTGPGKILTDEGRKHCELIRRVLAEVTSAAEAMLARLGEPVEGTEPQPVPHPTSLAGRARLLSIPDNPAGERLGEPGRLEVPVSILTRPAPPPEDQLSYQLPLDTLTDTHATFRYEGTHGEPDIAVWVPRQHWEGHFRRTGFLRADCTRVTDQ